VRAVCYTRISKEERDRGGVSLLAQADVTRAHCLSNNLEVVEVLADDGVSGGMDLKDRPSGKRLVQLVSEGGVQAIVALKLDRVFRDAIDALSTIRRWKQRNIAVHLLDIPGVDTSTAAGWLQLTVQAGVAEHERNRIRERTREALAFKRQRHELYARIPLGFRLQCGHASHDEPPGLRPVECRTLVPVDDEQITLETARRLRAAGHSYRRIAKVLTRLGRPTKRGGEWRASTIRGMLRNPIHKESR
jgi:DNA invertase Pin-like site-specific DNA recombinase